jgi:hypothetical protein
MRLATGPKKSCKKQEDKKWLGRQRLPLDRQPKATLHGSTLGDNAASSSH